MAAAANEADEIIKPSNSQPPVKSTETFFIDPFDSEPPKADTQTPDTWYPDRYPPAGFNSSYYDEDNRLNVTIDKDDYLPYGSTFHNYQGRKYDLANPINTYLTADLYIGSNWETENRHASLWATSFNETDGISGYPIFGFTNGSGFKIYSQDVDQDGVDTDGDGNLEYGWYTVGFPTSVWNGYDAWYTLEIKLTASSYKYFINDELVWTDIMTFETQYFGNMMLQGYNYNETYNIYWDNVGAKGPVENIDTGEEFSTIQAAIDDTDTLDGHTISVTDLTLGTSVNVTKNDLTFDLSDMPSVSSIVTENKSYNLAEDVESTFIGSTSLVFDGMQINTTGGNTVTVNNLHIQMNTTTNSSDGFENSHSPMLVNGQDNELIIQGNNTFDGRDDLYILEVSGTVYWQGYPWGGPGIQVQANRYSPNDELVISGTGKLTALGSSWDAGIGGSGYRYAGNVTINSGTIIAYGDELSAGIGGGQDSGRQDETATGSEHNWRPEPSPQLITINGGDVTATGGYGGAGIGTGGDCYNDTHGGTITINGGTIHAYGGDYAAGIGCGQSNAYELDHGTGGDITLTGGTIYAISGGDNASGIGGGGTYADHGLGGNCGSICIYPAAAVYPTGGSNVYGIGPGLNGDDCTYCDLPDPVCRNVEDNLEFITIQEAIDAPTTDDGETIEIYEGTHNQNFEISKRVNIIGSGTQLNPTVITQTTAGAGDTHIGVIQLNDSGLSETNPISIKNLRIEPIGMAGLSVGRFYQDTQTTISYIELDNVTVIGTNSNPSTEQERGLYVDTTSTLSYLNVVDSAFNNLTYGWYFQKIVSDDTSTVEHVTVTNTEFNHNNHKGIYAEKLEDATFTDCTINENGYDSSILPSYFQAWSAGIDLNLKAGDYETFVFDNCDFSENAIDEAKEGVALTVKERGTGNNPSGSYSSYPAHCDDVTVTSCTFTNNERGMRFGEPGKENLGPTNVTVEYCNIIDNTQHYSGTDGSAYGGLINQMQAEIIAECNWYNDISGPSGDGPGTGDAVQEVVGSIDYTPWLDDTYPDGDCVVGECVDTIYVDDNAASSWYDWDHVATIETAVERVCDPGTIIIEDGMYPEAVDLAGKELTVDGAGIGNTVINASTFSGYAISNFGDYTTFKDVTLIGSDHYGFKVSHVSHITLENIQVKDSGKTGIDLHTVDNTTLTNIQVEDTISGFGIMILDSQDITVTDITTSNNPWGGVSVHAVNKDAENIDFNGAFNANEAAPLLLEQDPPYADFINVDIPDKFDYVVYGLRAGPDYKQWYYQETLLDAKTFANGLMTSGFTYENMLIYDIEKENYYVIPGMLIQDAIDDATTDDIIHVDAGTYNDQVTINKAVSVIGEDTLTTIIDGDGLDVSWLVRIPNAAGDILFEGFTVKNALDYQMVLAGGISDVDIIIKNNLIIGNGGGTGTDYGLYGSNGLSNVTFRDNNVDNCNYHSFFLERWQGPTEVCYNEIVNGPQSGPGIGFMTYENPGDANGSKDVTTKQYVHHNDIDVNGSSGGIIFIAPFGWSYNEYKGGSYTNIEISNNTVYNVGDYGKGIQLEVDGDGGGIYDAIIADNDLTAQNTGAGTSRGIRLLAGASNTTIVRNTFTGFYRGVYQSYSWGQPGIVGPIGNQVHYNNFIDCTIGIENQYTTVENEIDATCNWWDDITGPYHSTDNPSGMGCNVSDNVVFLPWLTDEYPYGDCNGGLGALDIEQTVFNRGFPIRHAVDGDWGGAQSFIPTTSVISSVDIYLRMFGTPTFDLTVELREDDPKGTLIDTVTIPNSTAPTSWTWVNVDFEDTAVESGTDYFIVLPPAPSGVTTSFGYEWGYAFDNQYDDGSFWFTRDGGNLWRDLPTMYEFSFKTYGY